MKAESGVKIITVFGSSRPRDGDAHYALARHLGSELASRGFAICSGGYGGVMEAVSRGAKDAGGNTIGIVSEFFTSRESLDRRSHLGKELARSPFQPDRNGFGLCCVPGRHRNARGALRGLGNAQQARNARETVCHPRAFLGTDHRTCARSGNRPQLAVGRKLVENHS